MRFKASEIAAFTGNGALYNGNAEITGIATDSGDVKNGDMFVCIKGERTDGHKYVPSALKNGASCIFASSCISENVPYILVDNTVKALQAAAESYRKTLGAKIVGVTGSVGKTTTKEFIAAALSSVLSVSKTAGNKNSETGVPITVLGISKKDDAAVVEMGMSALGEISVLSKIAKPDIGVITNIGYSHIEHLKTRENILKAKLEILDGMEKNSLLILNGDDDMLTSCRGVHENVIFYGINDRNADYYGYNITADEKSSCFTAQTPSGKIEVKVNLPGKHNVKNALAAIAVGEAMGIKAENAVKGIESYRASAQRQNIYKFKDVTIYDDCYNSAPDSVKASLSVLRNIQGRKIAVLGDMLELGEMSEILHERAGESLYGVDYVYLYGKFAESFATGAVKAGVERKKIFIFDEKPELSKALLNDAKSGDVILFKASRGMHAEEIIKDFTDNYR